MATFTVMFEYFSRYADADQNYSCLQEEEFEAATLKEVVDQIEADEDFDDSVGMNSDADSDDLQEAGRRIVYVLDKDNKVVQSRSSAKVRIEIFCDAEELTQAMNRDEAKALDKKGKGDRDRVLAGMFSAHTGRFEGLFGKEFGDIKGYLRKPPADSGTKRTYVIGKKIEVGKLEHLLRDFSSEFPGGVSLFDIENKYYGSYRSGEPDSGGYCPSASFGL